VLLTGLPLRTDNYTADPRFSKDYMVWARTNGTIASMVVPILISGHVEGLLMDAYMSKPVKADELFATIDRFCTAASARNFLPGDPLVDLAAALRAMDGDTTLLTEMVALFQQVYPNT
jgi:hypothetical protein